MNPDGVDSAGRWPLLSGRVSRTPTGVASIAAIAGIQLRTKLLPWRDAVLATLVSIAAIAAGSDGFDTLDPALFGYLGACVAATFGLAWRVSAFWRRPASAFYARELLASVIALGPLRRTFDSAGRDLVAQSFIRRRSVWRWISHLLLSLGTLASFAITVPLVFGWMYFVPAGERAYRMVFFTVPAIAFDVDGIFGWLVFHGLSLAAGAVVIGAAYFVFVRLRRRRLPGAATSFALAPLLLLLVVALTGLALPASRDWPAAFRIAALLHEVSVVVLLLALPFSKLNHLLIRPLQLGARAVRGSHEPWRQCSGCGAPLAPMRQHQQVAALLAQRGMQLTDHADRCPTCRRRQMAAAQAAVLRGVRDSGFGVRS